MAFFVAQRYGTNPCDGHEPLTPNTVSQQKSTDYNFTKLEKRLRLMRRGQKGRRFEIIEKLLGPTSAVGHTDELLRQPKQATLLLQLPP